MTDISNQVPLSEILASNESRYEGNKTRCNGDCGSNYCDTNGCTEKERVYVKPINEKAEFAVQMLRKYAHQTGNMLRGTSDLSPLEEWLIIQLMLAQKEDNKACAHIGNIGLKKEITCPHCNKTAILVEKPIRIFNGSEYIEVQGLSYLCLCGSVFTTTESDTETMKRYYSSNSGKNIISPIDKI